MAVGCVLLGGESAGEFATDVIERSDSFGTGGAEAREFVVDLLDHCLSRGDPTKEVGHPVRSEGDSRVHCSISEHGVEPFTPDDDLRPDAGGFNLPRLNQVAKLSWRAGEICGSLQDRHYGGGAVSDS
jgi:hypothetical protein